MSITAKMTSFVPTSDVPVQLLRGGSWLAVAGSVGQPRDGDPAASFATFETVDAGDHLLPRALRCRDGGAADQGKRLAGLARRSPLGREMSHGQAFDPARDGHRRFYGRRVRSSRRHGDAVERHAPRHRRAAVDEDPPGLRRRGSRRDRLFRDGTDDPAAAERAACAGLFRDWRFHPPGLCRDRAVFRAATLYRRLPDLPLPYEEARVIARQDRVRTWPTCTGRTSFITTSSPRASCFAPPARPC